MNNLRLGQPTSYEHDTNLTETASLSHSHMPVKHLLKQLEIYRSTRRNRDIRPPWLTELIDRVSELFDPSDDVARVGFECRLTEDAWELSLFLGSTEIVGGPADGQTRLANFRLDLRSLLENFTDVEHIEWNAQPHQYGGEEPSNPSSLQITGHIAEERLKLVIFAVPPNGIGPGIREHINGECEPV